MYYTVTTKYVCGIDLHARTMSACVMDIQGKVLKKRSAIPCEVSEVMSFLKPWGTDITVGVESTYNWYWLLDALKENKIECCLGHALYIKWKMSSKHKSDTVDSRGIADLLRTNRFPVAYDYPIEMRTVRDMLRRRHFYVRKRASAFTHFQNSLHQSGCIKPLRNKLQYKSTRHSLVDLTGNEDLKVILDSDLEYIASLDKLIDDLDKVIVQKARHHNLKHYEALQTIPGCGVATSLTVLYETHTIKRFKTVQKYSSYCRVVRADNSSAGKSLGRTTNDKIGNPYLKWAISEIGQSMIKNYTEVRRWFQEQASVLGKAGVHARLRHKIAVAIYYMLKHDKVFDVDKFLGRNNSRTTVPSQKWTETSGNKSEPILVSEKPSGGSSRKNIKRNNKSGRASLRTTGRRKFLTRAQPIAADWKSSR